MGGWEELAGGLLTGWVHRKSHKQQDMAGWQKPYHGFPSSQCTADIGQGNAARASRYGQHRATQAG